jgi:tRNA(Ile)-lysidine synthase
MKHAEKTSFSVRRCEAYISRDSSVATVDVQKVQFPLTLRRVTEGDRMQPYGMKGSKLLSNLMTDLKMNLFEKRSQLVVVDANGVIVWAVGLRIDQKVAVSEHTKEVFELRIYS